MSFQELVQSAQLHFPKLLIKYKNESLLMKILGKIMFFNKDFMKSYTTTIGSTIYYPNETFIKSRPVSSNTILLHELVHINDSKKITSLVYSFLYLFPQILILLFFPLLFVSWKVALLALLFAAPLPAYFRMNFEKRAYFTSLYVLNEYGKKLNFNPSLDKQKYDFVTQFKGSSYYWMWYFSGIEKDFDDAIEKIRNNERPFEDPIFDILDQLIANS
jgi:hypothetical protein